MLVKNILLKNVLFVGLGIVVGVGFSVGFALSSFLQEGGRYGVVERGEFRKVVPRDAVGIEGAFPIGGNVVVVTFLPEWCGIIEKTGTYLCQFKRQQITFRVEVIPLRKTTSQELMTSRRSTMK
ncbi:MAG: hypothetical protein WD003_02615 [Candidatus Paceibacterota bacterium]